MAYQERWVRGVTEASGDRACADRYVMIRPVVERYTRQITVWDIGANLGYFGNRLADEFGAVSVMVDQRAVLADACRENALPTTIAMTHRLTAHDLAELAASEHADVVLALNVLHHMPDWREALPAVLMLGENIIIETPGIGDVGSANYAESQAILRALWAFGPEEIGTSPSHVTPGVQRPMFLFRRAKSAVTASYAYRERVRARGPHQVRPHTIVSTEAAKTIAYESGESRPWHHGINLWNWLQMGGSYPARTRARMATCVAAASFDGTHGDFKPWNLILQGDTVAVIDHGHRRSVDDAQGLKDTLACIEHPELAYAS